MMRSVFFVGLICSLVFCGSLFAGPIEDLLAKAKSNYGAGKFEESIQIYKEILSKHKDLLLADNQMAVQVWEGLAESLLRAGKKAEAQKAFERVAAHKMRKNIPVSAQKPAAGDPKPADKPPAPVADGVVVEELTNTKNTEVKDLFRSAMVVLSQGGSKTTAITYLLEASRKEPDNQVLLSKASLLIFEGSDTYLKNARTMLAHLNTLKKGKLTNEEAIAYARSLFLIAPFEAKEAEKVIANVLTADPKNLQALLTLAELDVFRAKYDKGMEGFNKIKELNPAELRAFWGIGYCYRGKGMTQEAIKAFEKAYEMKPDDAVNCARMGKAMLSMGKEAYASKYYHRALEIDPDNIDANLGLIPMMLRDCEDMSARVYLNKLAELDPGNPQLYLYQGMWNEMRQNLPEAVNYYELASAYGVDAIEAKLRLARIYLGIGHAFPGKISNEDPMVKKSYNLFYSSRKALSVLKEVMELDPSNPESSWVADNIEKLEAKLRGTLND